MTVVILNTPLSTHADLECLADELAAALDTADLERQACTLDAIFNYFIARALESRLGNKKTIDLNSIPAGLQAQRQFVQTVIELQRTLAHFKGTN